MTEATKELPRVPTPTREGWFEQYLPHDQAIARIKTLARNGHKGRRSVFLMVEQHGRTDAETYYPISGSVRITASLAVKFVEDSYKNFTERGALVRLSWCDTCLFVG